MTVEVIEAGFTHVANAESGWYVKLRGTREELLGDAGLDTAEASARDAGWAGGRAEAGWPSTYNLRLQERSYWFYGQELWRHHDLNCWCAHQFCPPWSNGERHDMRTCPKRLVVRT